MTGTLTASDVALNFAIRRASGPEFTKEYLPMWSHEVPQGNRHMRNFAHLQSPTSSPGFVLYLPQP